MPAAAAVALVAVAAGTTGYTAYQASQDKSEAIDEKGKQERLASDAATAAKVKSDKQASDAATAKQNADTLDAANVLRLMQQRRRNLTQPDYTKGGTLVTGPQGLGNPATTTPQKTLLGS